MQFHEYHTCYQLCRRRYGDQGTLREFTHSMLDSLRAPHRLDTMPDGVNQRDMNHVAQRLLLEQRWCDADRPYYSVYPFVTASFAKLPLDLDCDLIRLPLDDLLIRFAVGHEPQVADGRKIRSIMASRVVTRGDQSGLLTLVDLGELDRIGEPMQSYRCFTLTPGKTVEFALTQRTFEETRADSIESDEAMDLCTRIVCTLCLLGNDPELISPDVLDKDRRRFEETADQSIVDRAVRRGKRGWLVGARIESVPHYRRPHLGLRWTGHGRAVPRIVPIKGAVVHRGRVTEVPQGKLGPVETVEN